MPTAVKRLSPIEKRMMLVLGMEVKEVGLEKGGQTANPAQPILESQEKHNDFLLDIFRNRWSYDQEQLDQAKLNLKPEFILPRDIDWRLRYYEVDASKSGQYTLNPEVPPNFESKKIFIPTLKELRPFRGRFISEVGSYLVQTYGNQYIIPGIEYWEYIFKNPNQAPRELKDGKYYICLGSILRSTTGHWVIPRSRWSDSWFYIDYYWPGNYQDPLPSVVLLEKYFL